MQALHWYCFSFFGRMTSCGQTGYSSAYKGFGSKDKITLLDIESVKTVAQTSKGSTLLSVSYLGCMTKEELSSRKFA